MRADRTGAISRPGLLLAVLIYVALDLSLPTMPGAFVFEPADSVESIQINRGRGAAEAAPLPPPERDQLVVSRPRLDMTDRTPSTSPVAFPVPPVVSRLPRAVLDSPSSSEDPH